MMLAIQLTMDGQERRTHTLLDSQSQQLKVTAPDNTKKVD
jgi:hypothetical protein